ncbi:efflux RND transporter periplasmic adaptor subunit [Bauldia litoralis]|uniref:RND family efflux transporter, MFP subunit n=1 Tax=Bauldia litoralis TaxID=665467 RepID=A0A1G6CCU7_9HYPH|nr:efflux RND transporter periplasmic adaptor subunit [Bauldia litoralis]SDB30572.1 RND family efflux transporter, MFP subunit [Bauldia litoralis]
MSVLKQLLLSLVVIAVAAGGWAYFQRPELIFGVDASQQAAGPTGGGRPSFGGGPTLVVTAPVEMVETGTDIRAIGTAAAAREVVVYPQVTGIVTEVAFTPGTEVKAGSTLVVLEDADQQIAVELATLAQSSAQEAVDRAERLSKSGNVTAVTLSDAKTALQKASIDLRSAEIELAKRTIKAPFDGVIGLADISIGDLVNSSTAIATIADMSSVTVSFEVPERAVGEVAIGQSVSATVAALPGVTVSGELSRIDNRVDPTTRTLKVEATLPNDSDALRPGMAINIDFSIPGTVRPSVPSLAIQWDREGSFVWALDGDKVQRVPVQVVARRSGAVTVAGDLTEDTSVVVEGVLSLRKGQTVERAGANEASPGPAGDDAAPEPTGRPEAAAGAAAAAERGS